MGAIMPKKMPKAKLKKRRDNTDFLQFAEGGSVKKSSSKTTSKDKRR